MGASSQMIRSILATLSASAVPFFIAQKLSSVKVIGIWNRECAVRPPGISNAAIAEDATGTTRFSFDLNADIIVLYRKVFPVPPAP